MSPGVVTRRTPSLTQKGPGSSTERMNTARDAWTRYGHYIQTSILIFISHGVLKREPLRLRIMLHINERPEIRRFGYFPDIQISGYIDKKVPNLAV